MATAQETFDTVVNHLRKQGRRAYNLASGICLYRTPEGDKCAVGCLIKDEEYFPRMEQLGALHPMIEDDQVSPELRRRLGEHSGLLSALQGIHDSARGMTDQVLMNEWEHRFQRLAENNNLVYTPPTPRE